MVCKSSPRHQSRIYSQHVGSQIVARIVVFAVARKQMAIGARRPEALVHLRHGVVGNMCMLSDAVFLAIY